MVLPLRRALGCAALASLAGVLPIVAAGAQSAPAAAPPEPVQSQAAIHATIRGQFSKPGIDAGKHSGFRITAGSVTWEVDPGSDQTLLRAAERLAGTVVLVQGAYAERRDGGRIRRIVTAETIQPAAAAPDAREYVDVTVHGTLRTGVVAIGAETTGTTITAGRVTWDLELSGDQRTIAQALNGRTARVSGRLRRASGVERSDRFIVTVRALEAASGEPSPPSPGPGLPNRDTI